MAKLNQVIAAISGINARAGERITKAHHALQKPDLFTGHTKTYRPKNDDPSAPTGEQLPPDNRHMVAHAPTIIKETGEALTEAYDIEYLRELANCQAKADVVVDGKAILTDVPVTYLLFLEKKLVDILTFVKKLPTLDPAERWTWVDSQACYATAPVETTRTKKVVEPLVLYPATKEHPAQVKEVTSDVLAGFWSTIKYSSALPQTRVNELQSRAEALLVAVKFAREQANGIEVPKAPTPGRAIFDYLFG